jgi:hypothetical protein
MNVSKKTKYPEIRAELRTREQESRAIRKQIHESSGLERWGFWRDKRSYGCETRDLLLGYAFLRGRPYRTVEAKTLPNSGPYPTRIQRCLQARGHVVDVEAIEQWLEVPAPAAEQVAA